MPESQTTERAALLSHLAHDLRGKIGGVMLMLEVTQNELKRCPGMDHAEKDLDAARLSLRGVLRQLERHVMLLRLMDGSWPSSAGEMDLRGLAGELAAEAPPGAVEVHITSSPGTIHADATLLRTVLAELIDNAVKHGAAPVTIEAQADVSGWSIGVRDGGAGIDPARWAEVMSGQPDRRAGLGLRIARCAAATLGGRLERRGQTVSLVVG